MKSYIKIAACVTFLLAFFIGCNETSDIAGNHYSIHGSGKIVSQTRTTGECNGITVRNAGQVILTREDTQSIRIEADDNIIEHVISHREDGILITGLPQGSYSNVTLKIYVSLKSIQNISIEGAGSIECSGEINSSDLSCSINGAGNVDLRGHGDYLNCVINGAGNINAKGYEVKTCNAVVNGAGNCTVYVTDYLDASVNGVGTIIYYGDPSVVQTSISGVGEIKKG